MAFCASTFRSSPISPETTATTSSSSPASSTDDPAPVSAGERPPRYSTSYYQNHHKIHHMLRSPAESTRDGGAGTGLRQIGGPVRPGTRPCPYSAASTSPTPARSREGVPVRTTRNQDHASDRCDAVCRPCRPRQGSVPSPSVNRNVVPGRATTRGRRRARPRGDQHARARRALDTVRPGAVRVCRRLCGDASQRLVMLGSARTAATVQGKTILPVDIRLAAGPIDLPAFSLAEDDGALTIHTLPGVDRVALHAAVAATLDLPCTVIETAARARPTDPGRRVAHLPPVVGSCRDDSPSTAALVRPWWPGVLFADGDLDRAKAELSTTASTMAVAPVREIAVLADFRRDRHGHCAEPVPAVRGIALAMSDLRSQSGSAACARLIEIPCARSRRPAT
jgi:hypothetical protein